MMLIIFKTTATEEEIKNIESYLQERGAMTKKVRQDEEIWLYATLKKGEERAHLKRFEGVKEVHLLSQAYEKVLKKDAKDRVKVEVGEQIFGDDKAVIIAGPCAVESEQQLRQVAQAVKKAGAGMLRAGIFKPRTSPYSFQGLGVKGLAILKKIKEEIGLPVVSEIVSLEHLDEMREVVDMFQIGARNMQNFELLKGLSKEEKPLLLKRHMGATVEEFLLAAEYLMQDGKENIVLCERGIRRVGEAGHVLDVNGIAEIKQRCRLPIIADPSHAAGNHKLVSPLSAAALAAGADGLLVEVHPQPEKALCDGKQSLSLEEFEELMERVK